MVRGEHHTCVVSEVSRVHEGQQLHHVLQPGQPHLQPHRLALVVEDTAQGGKLLVRVKGLPAGRREERKRRKKLLNEVIMGDWWLVEGDR